MVEIFGSNVLNGFTCLVFLVNFRLLVFICTGGSQASDAIDDNDLGILDNYRTITDIVFRETLIRLLQHSSQLAMSGLRQHLGRKLLLYFEQFCFLGISGAALLLLKI